MNIFLLIFYDESLPPPTTQDTSGGARVDKVSLLQAWSSRQQWKGYRMESGAEEGSLYKTLRMFFIFFILSLRSSLCSPRLHSQNETLQESLPLAFARSAEGHVAGTEREAATTRILECIFSSNFLFFFFFFFHCCANVLKSTRCTPITLQSTERHITLLWKWRPKRQQNSKHPTDNNRGKKVCIVSLKNNP